MAELSVKTCNCINFLQHWAFSKYIFFTTVSSISKIVHLYYLWPFSFDWCRYSKWKTFWLYGEGVRSYLTCPLESGVFICVLSTRKVNSVIQNIFNSNKRCGSFLYLGHLFLLISEIMGRGGSSSYDAAEEFTTHWKGFSVPWAGRGGRKVPDPRNEVSAPYVVVPAH